MSKAAGDLLTELLRSYYLTESEAARRAGVSVSTIKNYRQGKTEPSPPKLLAVAGLFDRDDAARLCEAFGFPGLIAHRAAPSDAAAVLADAIERTRATLAALEEAYERAITGEG